MVHALGTTADFNDSEVELALKLIRGLDTVDLTRYSVVGAYTRFDERVRNTLMDARQRIAAGLERPGHRRENHLLWAAPGSGKTYLVQQIADSLADRISYREINLAKCDEREFRAAIEELERITGPVLCLVDEADAKPEAGWPYEVLLPYLDAGAERGKHWVIVLAGSSGEAREEMKRRIASRPKGADLLSRIPAPNEYDVAALSVGDRLLVALSKLTLVAQERDREIRSVEKLALLYVALTPYLGNARQLRDFAVRSIDRLPPAENRLRYDNLFPPGDPVNKEFWSQAHASAADLENSFVALTGAGSASRAGGHAPEPERVGAEARRGPIDQSWRNAISAWPHMRTRLIGRQLALTELQRLLLDGAAQVVTLTGPGGIGKTRLALEVAGLVGAEMHEGARMVSLAPLSSPALVAPAVGQALGLRDSDVEPLLDRILEYLRERELLLVLDNFEHVTEAAPAVASMLVGSPRVRVLVTSRMPLRVYGEREYPVPPLALPDSGAPPGVDKLRESAAAQLFLERAQAVRPDFSLTLGNSPSVATICQRLDGLPLAIELAAAQVKFFQPEALLSRLEHRLQLLTGGARDMPTRQQTLRNTIEWSYNLLASGEQTLLRRLSVFVGGFSLEAAEAVCGDLSPAGDAGAAVLVQDLASLADKSLLKQAEAVASDQRFLMLETIREYGLEMLSRSGESATFSRRHAEYFASFSQQAAAKLRSPEQRAWLRRLDAEHDNLRAALTWSRAAADADMGGAGILIRLASSLCWFWYSQGYLSEGRAWLTQSLGHASIHGDNATAEARAEMIFGIGALAGRQSDFQEAHNRLSESVAAWRELDRSRGLAWGLALLGFCRVGLGDYDAGARLMDESAEIFRSIHDDWGLAYSMNPGGRALLLRGDFEGARSRWQEGLNLFEAMNDEWGLGITLTNLVDLALQTDDLTGIQTLVDAASRACQESGDRFTFALLNACLGDLERRKGNYTRAVENYLTSLTTLREIAGNLTAERCAFGLGSIASSLKQPGLAIRFLAASDRYSGVDSLAPVVRNERDELEVSLHTQLTEEAFDSAWREGRRHQLPDIIQLAEPLMAASSAVAKESSAGRRTSGLDGRLSAREREVLSLLKSGLTNRQIADELVISERTAEHHVTSILQKLNLRSRAQAAAWASEHSADR